MALSKVTEGAVKTAPATATAPSVGATAGKASSHEAFRAKGNSIRKAQSEEERALEGSKSDKVKFVACLGDPNKPQPRREGKSDEPSFVVVGYQFTALEDMMIPSAPLKQNFKTLMDVEDMTEVPVKAGETFNLNIFETGVLISRPEYAGRFTGEGTAVSITIKFSKSRPEPMPVLKKDTKGSIKIGMVMVADMIPDPRDPEMKEIKGTPKVKDEFAEKFGVLYTKRKAGKTGSSTKAQSGEVQADLAAAFNAYIKSR